MTPETMILADGSEIIPVHYLSNGRLACIPGLTDFSALQYRPKPWLRSDSVESVTCPVCLAIIQRNESI